uniref:F-box domain-containing protein n=1 Tax=Odontella aurita TaxID=265563 RepID=A0A7S4M6R5_9STRA|mmetsp:Transcript_12937/g.37932  ORF Transcript_12937/g.37932 Transcript_12937/m.37932 type:complete len:376 (+) Transcript_12937:118-1245(+)
MGVGVSTRGADAGDHYGRRPIRSGPPHRLGFLRRRSDCSPSPPLPPFAFSSLGVLSDEILVEVLAFVGDGPLEYSRGDGDAQKPSCNATLTHVLPLVCKQFRHLIHSSDVLWSAALLRLFQSNPQAWEEGVTSILTGSTSSRSRGFGNLLLSPPWALGGNDSPLWKFRIRFQGRSLSMMTEEELRQYVSLLCQVIVYRYCEKNVNGHVNVGETLKEEANADDAVAPAETSVAKRTYVHLVREWMPRKLSLLHLPMHTVKIGQALRIDAFGPLYTPLVKDIMKGRSKQEQRGAVPLGSPRPEFVLSPSRSVPYEGMHALLVEVRRCHLNSFRQGDLEIRPTSRVKIIQIRERDSEEGVVDVLFRPSPELQNNNISN